MSPGRRDVPGFQAAYAAAFDTEVGADTCSLMMRRGISVGWLPVVGGQMQAAAVRWAADPWDVRVLVVGVLRAWTWTVGFHADRLPGWAQVLCGAPTWQVAAALAEDLKAWPTYVTGGVIPVPWLDLPADTGPLGWAAGLDFTEIPDRPAGDLAAMAGLRGFVLSPTPAELSR